VNPEPATPAVLDGLVEILGANHVLRESADLSRYCRDWTGDYEGQALAVIRPSSADEVAQVILECRDKGLAVVPQGGHTGLVNGALPGDSERHVVLSLERLNQIRRVDADNFSIVTEGGCILSVVKEAAEAADCIFPLSLGAQGSCQIGGNVATNAGGINVLRYGMMRELVLGLEVVLPDGRIWDGMTALRKDNRGVDLKQLFIGSEGILGVITAVTLKLFPRPEKTETAFVGLATVADAIALYNRARRQCSDLLTAFELIPAACVDIAKDAIPDLADPLETPCPVYVLLEAGASGLVDLRTLIEQFLADAMEADLVLDGTLAATGAQAETLWSIREGLVEGQALRGYHLRTDVSVAISDLAEFVDEATRRLKDRCPDCLSLAYGHIGDDNIHLNVLPPVDLPHGQKEKRVEAAAQLILDMVDAYRGSISAEHGIGRSKRDAFLSRISLEHRDMLLGLKRVIDPENLLNPGCIVPEADAGDMG